MSQRFFPRHRRAQRARGGAWWGHGRARRGRGRARRACLATLATTAAGAGWTAGFSFGDSAEAIASSWSATVSQSGAGVSASDASYDGAIPAGGSVTWGMVVNGGNQALSGLSCTIT